MADWSQTPIEHKPPKKRLVLFSGGFDSVVLLERLMHLYPNECLTLLFFKYGQPNLNQEWSIYQKYLQKGNNYGIDMPLHFLTDNDFFQGTPIPQKQYVEYRNLVFLSHAMNIAETMGIKEIYMGLNYVSPEENGFKDCDRNFIDRFNELIEPSGIRLIAPFAYVHKTSLIDVAREYSIEKDDFFSCNNPTAEGEPCGVCGDCKLIDEMYSYNPLG